MPGKPSKPRWWIKLFAVFHVCFPFSSNYTSMLIWHLSAFKSLIKIWNMKYGKLFLSTEFCCFTRNELFLPFSQRWCHTLQILGSKMEKRPNKLSHRFLATKLSALFEFCLNSWPKSPSPGNYPDLISVPEHDNKYSHDDFICIPRKIPYISCACTILLCLCLAAYSGPSFSCPKNPSMQNSFTEYSSSPGEFKSHWQILAQIKVFGIKKKSKWSFISIFASSCEHVSTKL